MKYQKFMKKIMEQLAAYKAEVDEMAVAYVAEKTKHEKQLKSEMDGCFQIPVDSRFARTVSAISFQESFCLANSSF